MDEEEEGAGGGECVMEIGGAWGRCARFRAPQAGQVENDRGLPPAAKKAAWG